MDENVDAEAGQKIDLSIYLPEAEKRLSSLVTFGLAASPKALEQECRRVGIIHRARQIAETHFPSLLQIPTTSEKPDKIDLEFRLCNLIDLYYQIFEAYPDVAQLNPQDIQALSSWSVKLHESDLCRYFLTSTRGDYCIEASVHGAIRNEISRTMDSLSNCPNEEMALDDLHKLLRIMHQIGAEHYKYYSYLDKHFGTFMHRTRVNNWKRVQELVIENELVIYELCLTRGNRSTDVESVYSSIMGYSPEEKYKLQLQNWRKVDTWFKDRVSSREPVTIDDIVLIHQQANAGILPRHLMGIRSEDQMTIELHVAPKLIEMNYELRQMLADAISLCQYNGPDVLFLYKLSQLAVRYAQIHPHADGNGTTGLLFCELIARIHGMSPANIVEHNYHKRVRNVFRNNILALTNLAVKEKVIMKQVNGPVESIKEVWRAKDWSKI